MRGLFNKHFWKFFVGFLAIMVGGFLLLFWANYYHNDKQREQKSAEKYLKDLEKAYQNDTYGGKTPEETLALFIDALKKGDINLAAKYFIVEDQEKWRKTLEIEKATGNLANIIIEAQKLKISKNSGEKAFFIIANEKNVVEVQVILALGPNNVWKIVDL